jgi:hypothetical protein
VELGRRRYNTTRLLVDDAPLALRGGLPSRPFFCIFVNLFSEELLSSAARPGVWGPAPIKDHSCTAVPLCSSLGYSNVPQKRPNNTILIPPLRPPPIPHTLRLRLQHLALLLGLAINPIQRNHLQRLIQQPRILILRRRQAQTNQQIPELLRLCIRGGRRYFGEMPEGGVGGWCL